MSSLFWLVITIVIYELSRRLKEKNVLKKIPPMVFTVIVLIVILKLFKIDYSEYNQTSCILTYLLGPATIALGYPLVENIQLLTKNKRAVYIGFFVAVITAIVSTIILGNIFNVDKEVTVSMIPKTVTTPIAVEISKTIGGIPELTACLVVLTGVYGALFGHKILKFFKIRSDIATGLAIGAASHVMGTSSCVEKNKPKQVVMATLSLIIIGILTSIFCVLIF